VNLNRIAPGVEPGEAHQRACLFDDSSFGGSSVSPSASATGGAEGEVLSAGRVHPKGDVLSPVDTGIDPVTSLQCCLRIRRCQILACRI